MKRRLLACVALSALATLLVFSGASVAGDELGSSPLKAEASGSTEFKDVEYGLGITKCPQAGQKPTSQPKQLDDTPMDKVEQLSNGGDDQRMNQPDYTCFPHNETSIDVNPTNQRNAVGGANDYRLSWGTSGFYATTDNGNTWYSFLTPFPTVPGDDHIDGGGDPAVAYDRAGVAYYVQIRFERETDRNGIFVNRSTNGGFTWSRPCVALGGGADRPPPDQGAVCGGAGDPRTPGDGVVTFWSDDDRTLNGNQPFDDKEYVDVGPRPAGVEPVCFGPVTRTPVPCRPGTVGVDRIHVTWTRFDTSGCVGDPIVGPCEARIWHSYSDDQARSWSPPRPISGSAMFCIGIGPLGPNSCDDNQYSYPTVSPATGYVYVYFHNFNTPDENQILVTRSKDGGNTWEPPSFVTPVFDVNYPRAGAAGGRPDCTARGQQSGRRVLTNSCFRLNPAGNMVVDKRGGEFADDLYLVMSDNRNGTRVSTNTDVFFFTSKDGGYTWIGPTRVNDDPSQQPANRACPRTGPTACPPDVHTGNDQWFPWVDISDRGDVNVNFYDRRLDTESPPGVGEWPTSKTRQGNYLLWRFGGICSITSTGTVTTGTTTIPQSASQCIAPTAGVIPQPTAPINPTNAPFPEQRVFPFKNFSISDSPQNWDYCFRAGIFCGDYDVVAIGPDDQAWAVWTDARNGRSSRQQPGRNPACEQSDAFVDLYGASGGGAIGNPDNGEELFWVTPCPTDMQDKGNRTTP